MRERLKKSMLPKAHAEIFAAVGSVCTQNLLLPIALIITVVGAVVTALLPPLILENIVDGLTAGNPMPITQAFSYFGVAALAGLLESTRESLLIVFGQKLTHGLRSQMCEKLSHLSADTLSKMDAGTIASRFVGDVDTLETLFTSGIISMFADACTMIGIYAVLWQKNRGLAITLLAILPLIALFIAGKHVRCGLGRRIRCKKIRMECPNMTVNLDGELLNTDCAEFEILPRALSIRAPK